MNAGGFQGRRSAIEDFAQHGCAVSSSNAERDARRLRVVWPEYIRPVSEGQDQPAPDPRPRITASLVESDESSSALLLAMGRAIIAAAGLERAMQLELAGLLLKGHVVTPNPKLERELTDSDALTAGQLLGRLRNLDLPDELEIRIADAIRRRNNLVHHTFEDPDLAAFVLDAKSSSALIGRINQLAVDCASLTVELELVAVPRLEHALGKSRAELVELANSIDLTTITDPRERQQLEPSSSSRAPGGLPRRLRIWARSSEPETPRQVTPIPASPRWLPRLTTG